MRIAKNVKEVVEDARKLPARTSTEFEQGTLVCTLRKTNYPTYLRLG